MELPRVVEPEPSDLVEIEDLAINSLASAAQKKKRKAIEVKRSHVYEYEPVQPMLELDSMKPYHDFVKSIEDSKVFT